MGARPYKDKTACTDMYKAGTLKVSKRICAADSRFVRGFNGASVSSTGCCGLSQAKREIHKVN
jgi:hypothetical protein